MVPPGFPEPPPADVLVAFPGAGLTLRGHLYRPRSDVPQAAIVWNHGSERNPGQVSELGAFYAAAGYVLFAPHRRGHGLSPGRYELSDIHATATERAKEREAVRREVIQMVIALHERHLDDLAHALHWLARQPYVDGERVAMSGVSHGGIQTLLAAEADLGPRAYIPFAPGAMAWSENPELRSRLATAVSAARAPIFLIQAANDHDLGPSRVLGEILNRKAALSTATVYPAYGADTGAGHGAFGRLGMPVWGNDVCAFLKQALPGPG